MPIIKLYKWYDIISGDKIKKIEAKDEKDALKKFLFWVATETDGKISELILLKPSDASWDDDDKVWVYLTEEVIDLWFKDEFGYEKCEK